MVSAYPPVGAEGHGPEAEGRDTQARRAQEAVVVELGQRLVNACLFGGRLVHLGFLRLLCLRVWMLVMLVMLIVEEKKR